MNWYIGQKIVAIANATNGDFKEGDIFAIKGLKQGCCCVVIDIGIKAVNDTIVCRAHKTRYKSNGIHWYKETMFAPLDEMTAHESAIKELLKETQVA